MEHHTPAGHNPFVGLIITLGQYVAGVSVQAWDISQGTIHTLQCFAFGGAILSAMVTVLNYFEIKIKLPKVRNPFKKKEK